MGSRSFERLRRARDLWPSLAASLGVSLERSGTIHTVVKGDAASTLAELRATGAQATLSTYAVWPSGSRPSPGVWTPEDWQLDPASTLAGLQRAFLAAGGNWVPRAVSAAELRMLQNRAAVVVATGWGGAAFVELAHELKNLSPIKGQILRVATSPRAGAVVRHRGGYIAASCDGLIVGATMEAGSSDLVLDPAKLDRLQAEAAEIMPEIAASERTAAAGVRAATPDGWPLVGQSSSGLWLSVGARRNGWLLAPLMAEVLHAQLDSGAHIDAAAFSPARFGVE